MSNSQEQQSFPLSDADLNSFRAEMIEIAVSFVLYGVYAAISIITLYLFIARGLHQSKSRVVLLIVTVFMFLLSTCSLALDLKFYLLSFSLYSPSQIHANNLLQPLTKISVALKLFEQTNYVISDGIVVWRAWVLYPNNLLVKLLLVICMLASVGGTYTDVITSAMRRFHNLYDLGSSLNILELTVPLLVTNIVSTSLIAFKAWTHRHALKQHLASSGSPFTQVQKVMILLVESGSIYCIIWIIYMATTLNGNAFSEAWQTFAQTLPTLAALYPILIILLVYLETSKEDDTMDGMSLSQSIRFASVSANVNRDHSTEIGIESQSIR
ncbi:hypothetical protein L218DRAFT_1008269 [Marasmius fiardii PR-910]|nr:hypothetical protein L218DRAFT_1008269 [Marasmius fiardii PR-910]